MDTYSYTNNGSIVRGASEQTDIESATRDLEKTVDKLQELLNGVGDGMTRAESVESLDRWVTKLGNVWGTYQEVSKREAASDFKNRALAKLVLHLDNNLNGTDHTLEEAWDQGSFQAAVAMAAEVYKRIEPRLYGAWALSKLRGDELANLHKFHQQFATLVGLEEGSPVLALHNQLSRWYRFGDKNSASDFSKVTAVLDRAFEAFVSGQKLTRIKPSTRKAA